MDRHRTLSLFRFRIGPGTTHWPAPPATAFRTRRSGPLGTGQLANTGGIPLADGSWKPLLGPELAVVTLDHSALIDGVRRPIQEKPARRRTLPGIRKRRLLLPMRRDLAWHQDALYRDPVYRPEASRGALLSGF